MAKPRLTREYAKTLAMNFNFPLGLDFHVLSNRMVLGIIDAANDYGYKKPSKANGSRARYFYAYLNRVARKG
jgi:hypothetical protein